MDRVSERLALVGLGVIVGAAFCLTREEVEPEKDAVLRFLRAQEERDLEAICACVTDDVVYINEPFDETRWIRNKTQFRKAFQGSPCIWAQDAKLQVLKVAVAQDKTVFVERLDQFLIDGTWVKIPICGYLQVREGKICRWVDYWDYKKYKSFVVEHFGPEFSMFNTKRKR